MSQMRLKWGPLKYKYYHVSQIASYKMILPHESVIIDGVWIGNWI
jgi:hypothetical protein